VRAVPEGTPIFTGEPILEITAPLPEAQVIETFVMNQVHLQTVLASKAARVVLAADGRRIVDFGVRRMHGADAGIKAARAFRIAGVDATSNVLAGQLYGLTATSKPMMTSSRRSARSPSYTPRRFCWLTRTTR
jgi:nicotinate phosphoribosyltransferase